MKQLFSNSDCQNMDSDAAKIVCRFKEFRQKGLFIDCIFTSWNKPEVKAHRIILSKNSTLLKHYFETTPYNPSNIKLNIPFNTPDHSFSKIVNFFYNNTIELTNDNVIILLAHSIIYGIKHLEKIIMDLISDSINKTSSVNFFKQVISFTISADSYSKFPDLAQNYDRFIRQLDFLAKYVAENYVDDELYEVFSCVNPRLLSMILKHSSIPDSKKVKIINDFVANLELTTNDMTYLTDTIHWENPDSYTYLVKNSCEWLLPKVSRKLYSIIITNRRISANAFQHKIDSISDIDPSNSDNKQAQGTTENQPPSRKLQNWFPFAWLTVVWDSQGKTCTPEVELSEFIGTLGGLVKFFNPVNYLLLESFASTPIHPKIFSAAYIFEDSKNYFLSNCEHNYIGFKMRLPCFKLSSIIVTFDNRERGKPMTSNTKLMYNSLGKMKLLISDSNNKTKFPNPVLPGVPFECKQIPVLFICVIPDTAGDGNIKSLRVSRLKSYGTFDVD